MMFNCKLYHLYKGRCRLLKYSKIAIAMIVMVCMLAGCGLERKPLLLTYDLGAEPKNLDPQTASDSASLNVINNIFEGLLAYNEDGKIEAAAASSFQLSDDKLTYTFILRDDIKWEDDTPVTAFDFQFAFRRLLDAETNSPHARLFYCIKNAKQVNTGSMETTELGVIATSATELVINLSYESKNFKELMALPYAVPCNEVFFKKTKGKYGLEPTTILANGAFKIENWKHDQSLKLSKSENYYDAVSVVPAAVNLWINTKKRPKPTDESSEEIEYAVVDRLIDEQTLAAFVDGFSVETLRDHSFDLEPIENSTWGIGFNVNKKLLQNDNLRKSIATAFDRSTYENKLTSSLSVANAIVPHGILVSGKSFRSITAESLTVPFDPKKGYEYYKNGLQELNIDSITGIRLLMPKMEHSVFAEYFSYPSQILQKELGVFIGVDEVEPDEYERRARNGEFDCILMNLSAADSSLWSMFSYFDSESKNNILGYKNGRVDSLLSAAAASIDIEQATANYASAEKLIMSDAVFLPMYYQTDYFAISQTIKGLRVNPQTGLVCFKDTKRN